MINTNNNVFPAVLGEQRQLEPPTWREICESQQSALESQCQTIEDLQRLNSELSWALQALLECRIYWRCWTAPIGEH